MTSNRPYLIRAMYDWIADNQYTPYVLVDATAEGVKVPAQVVRDGQVVLDLSMSAVAELDLGNEWITCKARFGGVSHTLVFPPLAVRAVYARENGQGMMFAPESPDGPSAPQPPSPGPSAPDAGASGEPAGSGAGKRPGPHLHVVK